VSKKVCCAFIYYCCAVFREKVTITNIPAKLNRSLFFQFNRYHSHVPVWHRTGSLWRDHTMCDSVPSAGPGCLKPYGQLRLQPLIFGSSYLCDQGINWLLKLWTTITCPADHTPQWCAWSGLNHLHSHWSEAPPLSGDALTNVAEINKMSRVLKIGSCSAIQRSFVNP